MVAVHHHTVNRRIFFYMCVALSLVDGTCLGRVRMMWCMWVLYCRSGLCVSICVLMKDLGKAEGGRMAIGGVCVVLGGV
jgi:hypothetical protein